MRMNVIYLLYKVQFPFSQEVHLILSPQQQQLLLAAHKNNLQNQHN